jgi:hypothetical protein
MYSFLKYIFGLIRENNECFISQHRKIHFYCVCVLVFLGGGASVFLGNLYRPGYKLFTLAERSSCIIKVPKHVRTEVSIID